jgi:hypothetical protein
MDSWDWGRRAFEGAWRFLYIHNFGARLGIGAINIDIFYNNQKIYKAAEIINNMDLSASPKYYIKTYYNCEDKYALFIFDNIIHHSNKLIESDEIDKHYTDRPVSNLIDINNGHCEDLSVTVHKNIVESEFNESRVEIMNRVWKKYGPGRQLHSWIKYKTKQGKEYHFDSECPWGVFNWKHLPAMFRAANYLDQSKFHDQHPLKDPYNDVRGFYGLKNK